MITGKIAAMATATVAALALAGCGGHSTAARSSASALASNPAAQHAAQQAEAAWKPAVDLCSQHQHWITHPLQSAKSTVTCTGKDLTPAQRKAAENCAATALIRDGAGHGQLAADEAAIAVCLAAQKPKP